jgi:glyoxylase-like metal-dependent hydrolase (beta-lactamase superfamily II)
MPGGNAENVIGSLGVQRVPVPVPFPEAGGPANIYVIEERGGGVALFDAGIGTHEGRAAIEEGFKALGLSLGDVRRIFVSHGHIDHYGYARAVQEASGAPVFVHPRDHDKVLGHDRTQERLRLYEAYLHKLGAPLDLLEHVGIHWMDARRMARPLEQVEALQPGAVLSFARFDAEVMHLPGHTPGLVCLWAAASRVLFSDDHLLEHVSPNPLVDLEGQREPRHKALVEYLRSIQRVRSLPVALVAPGHADPFTGHVALIDRLLGFYVKRQQKLLALLGSGAQSPAELSSQLFPRVRPQHLYLTLSETMGNLEVLEEQGAIARSEAGGLLRFELV